MGKGNNKKTKGNVILPFGMRTMKIARTMADLGKNGRRGPTPKKFFFKKPTEEHSGGGKSANLKGQND